MSALRTAAGAVFLAGIVVLGAAGTSCSPAPQTDRVTEVYAPTFASFQSGPSAFLERRCGTLDCHGQVGRPLRIYGSQGLRLPDDAGNVPGGLGTTVDEQAANYQATISLEPEMLSVVTFEQGAAPERLLLIKKPRLQEKHKGGQIIVPGDQGDSCLTSWLAGNTNVNDCTSAATAFTK